MANPWLKNKRKNWRDNPSMMDLYRQAMMNKYSSIQYPFGTGRAESATAEPAFIPPGRTPQPQEEFKEDVKTVITESEDPNVATKKVTTVTGGLMGDVPFDYGQDDPQNEKGMGMWNDEMAQLRARQEQGTAAPSQQDVEGALERYARMRRSQLAPPSRDDEQIAQVDPRIEMLNRLNRGPVPAYGRKGGHDYIDWSKRRASDRPGYVPDINPYDFTGEPGGGQEVPGKIDLGLPEEFQTRLEEQALTGFPSIRKQPEYVDAFGTDEALDKAQAAEEGQISIDAFGGIGGDQMGNTFVPPGRTPKPRKPVVEESEIVESEDVEEIQETPFRGEGEGSSRVAMSTSEKEEDNRQATVDVARADANPGLWQAWGDFVRKPGERKAAYMKNLSDIFRKAMIMNAVAQLTGGTSQADAYVKFATGKLDAIEKFDQEDRLQGAWKSIMFNEDGTFNPPDNYTDALDRAAKLGVSPNESKSFSALFPKESTSKFWVYDKKNKRTIRITDDAYIKSEGRYVSTADAGGRLAAGQEEDILHWAYHDEGNLNAEQRAEIRAIVSQPNAMVELFDRYPALMKLWQKKKDEERKTQTTYNTGLAAMQALAKQQALAEQQALAKQQQGDGTQTTPGKTKPDPEAGIIELDQG
mgnify:CR=1 FL=1